MKKSLFSLLFTALFLSPIPAQTWIPEAAGLLPVNYAVYSVSAIGENVVWAVASELLFQPPIPNTHHPLVLRTSDGGQTWIKIDVEEAPGVISFQIVAVDSLTAWITTQDYGGGGGRALYQTTDGGIVWVKQALNNSNGGVALNRFSDGQHWLAHNRQGKSLSENNGASWLNSTVTGYQSGEFQLLTSGANISATAGDTLWNGTSAGRVVRFTNFGKNAEFLTTGLGSGSEITSIAFHDHLNGLLYYGNPSFGLNRIARSTDGGVTWASLPPAQQPGNLGWNIASVPGAPGSYVLVSDFNTANGKTAITRNFGATWTIENVNKPLNSVVFTSPESGWAGAGRITAADQPALFRYNGSSLVTTKTPPVLPGFSVSPNPAGDELFFRFDDDNDGKPVFATLTDANGRQVFSGTLAARKFDTRQLPPGVYFLQVEHDGKVGVETVVKQ